jgi:hypothetical protein
VEVETQPQPEIIPETKTVEVETQPQPEIIPETKTVEVETQPQPEIIPEQTLTVEFLKTKYKTFKKAKEALQIKARSWQSLAEKLYEKS